jgi:hypothetical protein
MLRKSAPVALVALLGAVLLPGCGSSSDRRTGARERYDPYVLTAGKLRRHLSQTGIHIRFVPAPKGTLRGVASVGPEFIGFEYELFPSARMATTHGLRRVKARDFGWSERPQGASERVRIRGVLSNVAFAEYEKLPPPSHRPRRSHFPDLRDEQTLLRTLDNALFSSFPPDDAYVHPLLNSPGQ